MTDILPRTDLAIEFLLRWRPEGPWVLTAISPTAQGVTTRTFQKDNLQAMEDWIAVFQNKRNLYFTINSVKGIFDSKPKRIDVTSIDVLHVDLDARAGEDLEEEKTRIFKSLAEFKPHPSIIISSGGGAQAYWLLETPIPLDGTEHCALNAERYSVQLELLLAGDKTSNCDRIMRLPGTTNLPNEVKLKKGRIPALAEVVEWEGTKYPLSAFIPAPTKVQVPNGKQDELPGGGEQVTISGNIAPLYVDQLPEKGITISEHIKALIIYGENPEFKKYKSRSEAVFSVCCSLVRAGADDDTIAAILLNRDNKISESIFANPRPERYCAKQIQSAKEHAEDPKLHELNSKFAVIGDMGGRCKIISETFDHALRRPRISFQGFTDFLNRFCHEKVKVAEDKDGKDVFKPLGQFWINHPKRRQYDTIVFAPGREVPEAYNLWMGFSVEAKPGDCSLFMEHITKNLCRGNEEQINYLLNWMARAVQQPDCPGEVALVLRGDMGTGKSFFASVFGALFGRHFLQVSDPKHLVGSFNSHMRDVCVLFSDEAFFAGDKKHESVLKSIITEKYLSIESKGVDLVASPNYIHLILASNSQWVVPAGNRERRFFVLEVGTEKMQDKKYFSSIRQQLDNGGKEALLHYLLGRDISNFEVREIPKTDALQDQKLLSMGNEDLWWYEKLEEGRILREHDIWEKEIQKDQLQNDYISFMQRTGIIRKASATVLGKFLGRVCPNGVPRSYQRMARVKVIGGYGEELMVNRRTYFYEFPELGVCREHWDKHHGGPFNWPAPLDKGEQGEIEKAPEEGFE